MDDFKDLIGMALGAYTAREQNKVDARLQASRDQQLAYDQAQRYQNVNDKAESGSKWAMVAGLAAVGLVVYMVAK